MGKCHQSHFNETQLRSYLHILLMHTFEFVWIRLDLFENLQIKKF